MTENVGLLGANTDSSVVEAHSIAVALDFSCAGPGALKRLASLTAVWVDAAQSLGLLHPGQPRDAMAERRVFQPATLSLSSDLHPAVMAALRGDQGTADRAVNCLSLTAFGLRLLNGELARPAGDPRQHAGFVSGRGIALLLGPESWARIMQAGGAAEPFLRLQVDALDVIAFRSGIGMAVLRLHVTVKQATRLSHVQEALHVLSNALRSDTLGWACEAVPAGRFNLRSLLDSVLKPAGCADAPWSRLFTHIYAQLDGSVAGSEALEIAAWRLSRHYTAAYVPGPDYRAGTALARPFDGVLHAASMEGVASLSVAQNSFLRDNFKDRVASAYLPLALLAFHEHVLLLDMAHRASGNLGRAGTDAAAERRRLAALQALTAQFLEFRLCYRLPLVSDITMHNRFYAAARAGLEVEALMQKLAGDTSDMARALHLAHQRQRHAAYQRRERARAGIIGLFAGMLTFLTSAAALKEVQAAFETPGVEKSVWDGPATAVPAALLLAVLSGVLTSRRHRDAHEDGDEEDETGNEQEAELAGEAVHVSDEMVSERQT